MPIGTTVRKALGRFEPAAIRMYRSAFIDLDSLAVTLATVATAKRILEIGCGDGALAAALRRTLADVELVGIDPGMVAPGCMYDGDRSRVEFRRIGSAELIAENPEPFDLVVVCDVLHHVAEGDRAQVLRDAAALTAAGGTVAVNEWEDSGRWRWLAYLADRWVSGDPTVRFMPRGELDRMIRQAMPGWRVSCEARIPPRRANLLLMLQRS